MTGDLDLFSRFADVAYPAAPESDSRFGKLDQLASWLAATGLSNRAGRAIDRQVVVFYKDQPEQSDVLYSSVHLPELVGIKVSRHALAPIENDSVEKSIGLGIQIADRAIDSGTELLFVTSVRFGDDHDLEILIGALTRSDAASVASRQVVSDQKWIENVIHVRDEIFALRDQIADPIALLTHTHSIDVAEMLGVILQSAYRATPVVVIGDGAHCAALLASRISHLSREWLIPAVDLTSPAGAIAQAHLNRQPILELAMTFQHDYLTPVSMTAPIIDAVLELLAI